VVCDACWCGVTRLTPPFCRQCGDALASWRSADVGGGICTRCRRRGASSLDGLRAAGRYDGRLRAIVHAWKYGQRRSLSGPLARLAIEAAGDLCAENDALVPVPLHRARRRDRGFNQAEDLAAHLGLPVLRALRRVRATRPQFELSPAARRRNVRDAFAIAPASAGRTIRAMLSSGVSVEAIGMRARLRLMREDVRNRRLLLVDDVSTTGATLEACARVLKEAGAMSVSAVTVARAVIARRR
jgi:predicted amidophosphoribosyltransferase